MAAAADRSANGSLDSEALRGSKWKKFKCKYKYILNNEYMFLVYTWHFLMHTRSLILYSNLPKPKLFIQKTKTHNSELLHSQAVPVLGGSTILHCCGYHVLVRTSPSPMHSGRPIPMKRAPCLYPEFFSMHTSLVPQDQRTGIKWLWLQLSLN